jgi:hypothetical protein
VTSGVRRLGANVVHGAPAGALVVVMSLRRTSCTPHARRSRCSATESHGAPARIRHASAETGNAGRDQRSHSTHESLELWESRLAARRWPCDGRPASFSTSPFPAKESGEWRRAHWQQCKLAVERARREEIDIQMSTFRKRKEVLGVALFVVTLDPNRDRP